MLFHFYLNGKKVGCPLSYSKKSRCPRVLEQEKSVNTSELFKLDRSVIFAELHKETNLVEFFKKLTNNCTYESPNTFWSRE